VCSSDLSPHVLKIKGIYNYDVTKENNGFTECTSS